MVEIIQDFIPKGSKNRPGIPMSPKYITVHNTANSARGADALRHASYLKGSSAAERMVSWHYTVDDKRIVQHLPTNEVGWHAGDGRNGTGNRYSIGIEICENEDGNFEKAVQNAVWLIKKLMKEHNISIDRVVPHKRWTGKQCPRKLLDRWGWFINQIQNGVTEMGRPILKRGSRGEEVKVLQEALNQLGFNSGAVDGIFGAKTENAVKAFQKAKGLVVDGIVGPKTWAAIDAALNAKKAQTQQPKPVQNNVVNEIVKNLDTAIANLEKVKQLLKEVK